MNRRLVSEHGSPLWLADVAAVRRAHAEFRAAFGRGWGEVAVAYSYKTNRLGVFLAALAEAGALAEVVCEAEYRIAREVVGVDGPDVIVNGPAKSATLLTAAASDGALVMLDDPQELARAAEAGVRRVGLRIAVPGALDAVTRFGMPEEEAVRAAVSAHAAGMRVEALHAHVVSTDLDGTPSPERTLAERVRVRWPRGPGGHAAAADLLAGLAADLARRGVHVGTLDLGGGFPAPVAMDAHVAGITDALRRHGFRGRLVLEPGRALVAGAMTLLSTVVAVKRLPDGRRAAILDAGTNVLPGALWSWPRIDPADGPTEPTLLCGPLCLNTDVLHPAADLAADLAPGDVIAFRDVGAYHDVHSTRFGEPRPAVVARDGNAWTCVRRRETLADLLAGERHTAIATTGSHRREVP